ncbi:MAG: hypothetical protein N2C14_14775 [Planctomycetales bacterium]
MTDDSSTPSASPAADAQSPGARWVSEDSPEPRRVGQGLSLVYFGIIFVLLGVTGGAFGSMIAAFLSLEFAIGGILVVAGLMIFAGVVMNFVGPVLCLAVPDETGAKELILAAVFLQVLNPAAALAQFVLGSPVLGLLGALAGAIGMICFMLFLRQLAFFIEREDFAQRASNLLVFAGVLAGVFFLTILGFLASVVSESLAFGLSGLLMFPIGMGGLICLVRYAGFVNDLRRHLLRD